MPSASDQDELGAGPGARPNAPLTPALCVRPPRPPLSQVTLVYRAFDETDGIGAYCDRLVAAIADSGIAARTVDWRSRGLDVPAGAVILQYNPFAFGRWGFAPRLVLDLARLARRHPQTRRAVMVHEPFVPIDSLRSLVMGVWQRLQLRALLRGADVVLVSTSAWSARLPRRAQPLAVPVGSNLPDRRQRRLGSREAIGAGSQTVVLATFGTGHPSRRIDHIVAAANAVADHHGDVILLALGTGTQPLLGLHPRVTVRRPGRQSAHELACELSCADIFLAPFVDGLTTRRTSFMAALQHGLAVAATDGPLTEPDLRREEAAVRWARAGDLAGFAAAAVELAGDPELRAARARAARSLYERRFSWTRIAQLTIDALASARS